jgi:RimJ/RimL family protein N-acetyltransferase
VLRPIEAGDLAFYKRVLSDERIMSTYTGGAWTLEEIERRFQGWLDRWHVHPFSALAILDRTGGQLIGHALLGHGNFAGDADAGCAEIALVLDSSSWNADFTPAGESPGRHRRRGMGTDVSRGIVGYAKALAAARAYVPCDISDERRAEAERMLADGRIRDCIRRPDRQVSTVFLPFASVRASVLSDNIASVKLFDRVWCKENPGRHEPSTAEHDWFSLSFDADAHPTAGPAYESPS